MQQTLIVSSIIFIATFAIVFGLVKLLPVMRRNKSLDQLISKRLVNWLAFYLVFAVFVISNQLLQVLVMLFVAYRLRQEVLDNINEKNWFEILAYSLFVMIGMVAFWMMTSMSIETTIAIAYAAILSELGQILYRTIFIKKLQNFKYKHIVDLAVSFAATAVALILISVFVGEVSIWLTIPVALALHLGEYVNKFVKSKINIKQWDNFIPARGGFIDAFAALSLASTVVIVTLYL